MHVKRDVEEAARRGRHDGLPFLRTDCKGCSVVVVVVEVVVVVAVMAVAAVVVV